MESLRSFNDTLSQSLPRRPGAWDSPAGTMRKASNQGGYGVSVSKDQLGGTGRSVLNETIQSMAPSGTGDEIHNLQVRCAI